MTLLSAEHHLRNIPMNPKHINHAKSICGTAVTNGLAMVARAAGKQRQAPRRCQGHQRPSLSAFSPEMNTDMPNPKKMA